MQLLYILKSSPWPDFTANSIQHSPYCEAASHAAGKTIFYVKWTPNFIYMFKNPGPNFLLKLNLCFYVGLENWFQSTLNF